MHRFPLNFFVRVSRDHFKFKTISKRETPVWFSVCEQVYFFLSLSFPVLPIIAAAAAAKEGLRNLGDLLLLLRFPNSLAEEEEESSLNIGAESFARKKKFPPFRESLFPNLGKGESREGQAGGGGTWKETK